ncbi:MAG: acyltransferase [Bacteroidales bacterium]|nr:acyltransferase [Bacteroidales bacterium]
MRKFVTKISHIPRFIKKRFFHWIANLSRNSTLLLISKNRVRIWRLTGCKVGKGVVICLDVYYDVGNANLITIEDDVGIMARSVILCHKRDMKKYYKNERYMELPYIKAPVVLKKGSTIGTGAMIMPGVTVGEGASVGAYSLVTKDVPPWTIVAGSPAKVIREIKERDE